MISLTGRSGVSQEKRSSPGNDKKIFEKSDAISGRKGIKVLPLKGKEKNQKMLPLEGRSRKELKGKNEMANPERKGIKMPPQGGKERDDYRIVVLCRK